MAEKARRLMAGGSPSEASLNAFRNRKRPDEEVLSGVPGELAALLADRRREIAQMQADSRFTEEYRFQALQEARARHAEGLRAIREKAEAARERLSAAAQEAAADKPLPTDEALLREMQLSRAWSRYRTLLEGGADPEALVGRGVAEGEIAVSALSEELPSFLEGRGHDAPGIAAIGESLEREREPYLSAEQRAGRQPQGEIADGWSRLEVGFAHVSGEMAGTFSMLTTELPAYEGGTIPVEGVAGEATEGWVSVPEAVQSRRCNTTLMAWERRERGRRYYTRSRREGGRVVREYVGTGPLAELAASSDALEKRRREEEGAAERAERERLDALEKPVEEFCEAVEILVGAALVASGYHKHERGEWRKRRE